MLAGHRLHVSCRDGAAVDAGLRTSSIGSIGVPMEAAHALTRGFDTPALDELAGTERDSNPAAGLDFISPHLGSQGP